MENYVLGYVCVVLLPPYVNVRTLSPTDTRPSTCLKQERGFCARLKKTGFSVMASKKVY